MPYYKINFKIISKNSDYLNYQLFTTVTAELNNYTIPRTGKIYILKRSFKVV